MKTNSRVFLSVAALVLAAGVACPTVAIAQPAAANMGVIGNNNTSGVGIPCNASVTWFRIQLAVPTSPSVFYDFRTESNNSADVELAVFNSAGTLIAQNDDWDSRSRDAGLSFGSAYPRRHYDY